MSGHPGLARARELAGSVRELWREFTGESAYDRYVLRHRLEHPDHEPMDERRFWRARSEFAEQTVHSGCC